MIHVLRGNVIPAAEGTRVQVVSLLARSGEPMTVKEIVAAVPVSQSMVTAHLNQLATVGFVIAEERDTSRLYRITRSALHTSQPPPTWSWVSPPPVPAAAAR